MAVENQINDQNLTEEQKEEFNKPIYRNRKYRRMAKKRSGLTYHAQQPGLTEFMQKVSRNLENGRQIQNEHRDQIDSNNYQALEERMQNTREILSGLGYTQSQIEQLEEAYTMLTVRDKDNWQEEKKQARQIIKQVEADKNNRQQ